MVICLCATRNMYAQLFTSISFLQEGQPSLKKIYAFVEDDLSVNNTDALTFVDLSNFSKIKENQINGRTSWSYMTLARLYFTQLLPDENKVIYLDLDTMVRGNLKPLWDTDLHGKEIAGVIDSHIKDHNFPYITNPAGYINAGVMLMDLDRLRENGTDKKIDQLICTKQLTFPDQDCINLTCDIMQIDCRWNSGYATSFSDNAVVYHPVHCKPWNPCSRWFPTWAHRYLLLGTPASKFDS